MMALVVFLAVGLLILIRTPYPANRPTYKTRREGGFLADWPL